MTGCRSIRDRRSFPRIVADGRGFAARRATVTEIIRKQMAEAGADYFVGQFAFGDLTLAETRALDRIVRPRRHAGAARTRTDLFRARHLRAGAPPLRPGHPIRYIEADRSTQG